MKVAAITRTMGHTDTVSLMEALSTSCVSFLSALRPKLQQHLLRGNTAHHSMRIAMPHSQRAPVLCSPPVMWAGIVTIFCHKCPGAVDSVLALLHITASWLSNTSLLMS